MDDVATLARVLQGGVLEVGQVLAREREDRGCGLLGERDVVCSGGLIAVGGAPEVEVGDGTEVDSGFNRLVGGAILSETDGVVGG